MSFISLDELQPTKISRDLKGKFVLFYGMPKVGKTTVASSFPRNLLLATEVGYHGLANIYAVNIDTWSTFKRYMRELELDRNKERFDTITIDTVSLLWDLCEKYVCQQYNVRDLGEIAWGRGFAAVTREFNDALLRITLLGYGLVVIAHSEIRTEKDNTGNEVQFVGPALNKRAYQIVNRIVDIIGYISNDFDEEGQSVRKIYTRATPTVMAGSRFKHFPPVIPLSYEALADALTEAIERIGEENDEMITDESLRGTETVTRPFEETMEEARALFFRIRGDDRKLEQANVRIKEWFGVDDFRLSAASPAQQELVENVILDMKSLL